jgi:hypothetical protein
MLNGGIGDRFPNTKIFALFAVIPTEAFAELATVQEGRQQTFIDYNKLSSNSSSNSSSSSIDQLHQTAGAPGIVKTFRRSRATSQLELVLFTSPSILNRWLKECVLRNSSSKQIGEKKRQM